MQITALQKIRWTGGVSLRLMIILFKTERKLVMKQIKNYSNFPRIKIVIEKAITQIGKKLLECRLQYRPFVNYLQIMSQTTEITKKHLKAKKKKIQHQSH